MAPRMEDKTDGAEALKWGCFQCKCLMSLQSFLLQHTFGCQKMFVRYLMTNPLLVIQLPLWSTTHNAPSTKSLPMSITKFKGAKNTLQIQVIPVSTKQWTQISCDRITSETYTTGCQLRRKESSERWREARMHGQLQKLSKAMNVAS